MSSYLDLGGLPEVSHVLGEGLRVKVPSKVAKLPAMQHISLSLT